MSVVDLGVTNMCRAVNIEGVAVKATFCSRICVGDSDDSDTEGGLGNVERVVMRPPGHSGKAKQGHLCFNAAFETGNLGRVDFITENEYDLFARPDTCNPRIRFWFHFSVENVQKGQRIVFNVVNLSKTRNLFQRGMTPVVKSTKRPRWQRLPSKQVYYYRCPDHSGHMVLSFAFAFDEDQGEKYFFALSFPYSYTRCMAVLRRLALKRPSAMRLESVAKSVQDRDVPLVIIEEQQQQNEIEEQGEEEAGEEEGDEEEEQEEDEELDKRGNGRPTVIIIARVHPGDSNTSFIVQGMLEFLTSDHAVACELRTSIDFYIFPMMNPDGVFLGNARSSLFGLDLNRSWHRLGTGFPELNGVREFVLRTSKKRRLDFVLDVHCSFCLTGVFVQGNSFDSVYRFERHLVFPKLLAQNCPDFELDHTMYNADSHKEGTCRRFVNSHASELGTNTYSVEVSAFGYQSDGGEVAAYSEEDYLLHGRRIARSLWEYYKVTGVIESKFALQAAEATATFSMLRLRNIAHQRDVFSSLESLSSSQEDDEEERPDEEDDAYETRRASAAGLRFRLNGESHHDTAATSSGDEEQLTGGSSRAAATAAASRRRDSRLQLRVIGQNILAAGDDEEVAAVEKQDTSPITFLSLSPRRRRRPATYAEEATSVLRVSGMSPTAVAPKPQLPSPTTRRKAVGGGATISTGKSR